MVLNGILRESRFQRKDINSFIKTDKLVPFTKYSMNDTIGYHQMYNHEDRIKWITERYSEPEITYYDSPVIVDNEKNKIIS